MRHEPAHKRSYLRIIIAVCCLLVVCVSAYMVISQLVREKRDEEAFEALIDQIGQTEPTSTPDPGPVGSPPPQAEPTPSGFHKYDALYEQNHDLFGWVCIDGTKLNYPVMHTPDDPEHYLRRAFDETYSVSGVPFLDGGCYTGCGNYIVYGHHMKNGTMFAALADYADESFWREHPVIQFDTLDGAGEYEVLAAFYSKAYKVTDKTAFRYYNYTDLTNEAVFDEYLDQVRKASLYDTGVTAEYGDQLLTLSTCSYYTANGRFVVVARKV